MITEIYILTALSITQMMNILEYLRMNQKELLKNEVGKLRQFSYFHIKITFLRQLYLH